MTAIRGFSVSVFCLRRGWAGAAFAAGVAGFVVVAGGGRAGGGRAGGGSTGGCKSLSPFMFLMLLQMLMLLLLLLLLLLLRRGGGFFPACSMLPWLTELTGNLPLCPEFGSTDTC